MLYDSFLAPSQNLTILFLWPAESRQFLSCLRVGIRMSPEVMAHFMASGNGWQTRIDAALRQFIAEHPG
jgi:hypothetical protein